MQCYVYKGDKKEDHFLYLKDQFDPDGDLPAALLAMLGELALVIEFELTADRVLAQADASQVLNDIAQQGYYLQMPKKDMAAEETAYFN